MKRNFLYTFVALVALAFTFSCEATDSTTQETTSKLILTADNYTLDLDSQQAATFTITYEGEDVTDKAVLVNTSLGGYEVMTSNVYTTLRPGSHTFFAMYDGAVSESIELTGVTETGISSVYYRQNMIFKFTATWCTYCPNMTTAIASAQSLYPDRLVEMAIHVSDDLAISDISSAFTSAYGITGYPTAVIDGNKDYSTSSQVASILVTYAKNSLAAEPTTVGMAIESSLVGTTLNVDVETHFTETGTYKLAVAFLQSGFNYEQTGATSSDYTQDHVVRWFFSSITGDYLGDNYGECVVGERVQSSYSQTLDVSESVLTEALLGTFDIVAYVLKKVDDTTYHINNAVRIGVNESLDYQYEPIVTEE